MINIYYNYLLLVMLEFLNRYEKASTIPKEKLEASLKIYMEILKNDCAQVKDLENINKVLEKFPNYNQDKLLQEFAETYANIISLKNNNLFLKEGITSEDIEEELRKIRMEYPETTSIFEPYNIDCERAEKIKQLLNITTVDNTLEEYLQIEYLIECLYYNLYNESQPNIKSKIKKLLIVRDKFFELMEKLDITDKQTYQEAITHIRIVNQEEYEELPITIPQEDNEKAIEDIAYLEINLYNIYQYAIFNENPDYCNYVEAKISSIYFNDLNQNPETYYEEDYDYENYEEEYEEEINDNDEDNNKDISYEFEFDEEDECFLEMVEAVRYFYLTYLTKLNEYINNTPDKKLINVKRRLLYLLDNKDDKLYLSDRYISLVLDNIEVDDHIDDYCNQVKKEACMMLEDIFNTEDEHTIQKVLFISTYYHLTKDKEILNLLNKNTIHPRYLEYKRIIIGPQEKHKTKTKNL